MPSSSSLQHVSHKIILNWQRKSNPLENYFFLVRTKIDVDLKAKTGKAAIDENVTLQQIRESIMEKVKDLISNFRSDLKIWLVITIKTNGILAVWRMRSTKSGRQLLLFVKVAKVFKSLFIKYTIKVSDILTIFVLNLIYFNSLLRQCKSSVLGAYGNNCTFILSNSLVSRPPIYLLRFYLILDKNIRCFST